MRDSLRLYRQAPFIDLKADSRWAQSLILILLFFGGSALLTSFIIKIDEVITVSGTLRPISGTRNILAPEPSELQLVSVKDGQSVSKGQELVVYDTEDALIRQANLKDQLSFTKEHYYKI